MTGLDRVVNLGAGMPSVCRLGLATRGNASIAADDALYALERGINYWNWCGHPDGMSSAARQLGAQRNSVVLAAQVEARTAEQAAEEFERVLAELHVDYLDVATLYYVESEEEWARIVESGGGWDYLAEQKRIGRLRAIGLTTHQRPLAARWARTGRLDLLMVRYNAAHRGAERDVFPVANELRIPVVTFTALRWRALVSGAATAADCYRFCVANPSVTVTLAAPADRPELDHVLKLLDDWRAPSEQERVRIIAHGDNVRRTAGTFW